MSSPLNLIFHVIVGVVKLPFLYLILILLLFLLTHSNFAVGLWSHANKVNNNNIIIIIIIIIIIGIKWNYYNLVPPQPPPPRHKLPYYKVCF
jgi:hypothetical protein